MPYTLGKCYVIRFPLQYMIQQRCRHANQFHNMRCGKTFISSCPICCPTGRRPFVGPRCTLSQYNGVALMMLATHHIRLLALIERFTLVCHYSSQLMGYVKIRIPWETKAFEAMKHAVKCVP